MNTDPESNCQQRSYRLWLVLAGVATLMTLGALLRFQAIGQQAGLAGKPAPGTNELAALRAEIEQIKGKLPDQSHAMKDVAYHFANLWFAGRKKNWPLAEFYWSETRSHLHWAVRIIPVRKDAQGNEIRLAEILESIEKGSLEQVHQAISEKNEGRFATAYKQMLDSCYACHLAAGKAFLTLEIPAQPEAALLRFDAAP